MSAGFNFSSSFERLLESFDRDRLLAASLHSPNSGDDLAVRAAIVGFSYNSSTESWGRSHFDFLQKHLLDRSSLSEGEFIFSCECLGYLLGLYEAGKISDEEFRAAEAQIPGFILLKGDRIPAA